MRTLVLLGLALFAHEALAVDRIVEEFGVSPTYPNITSAVAAAVDGDRIIIKNRAGDIPWIESITIDKSLQFLSYANDGEFVMQGGITINSAEGREITIIGMRNTAGSIVGSGPGSWRSTKVRIMDSRFVNGSIVLNSTPFDVNVVGCTLQNGTVSISYGNVVGNDIDGSAVSDEGISVSNSLTGTSLDTCAIVGNKVKSIAGYEGIFVNTPAQVVHIRNNYVQHGWMGIEAYAGNGNGVQNLIWNNTVLAYTGNFTTYGISLANTTNGSVWEVMNNVVTRTWSGENRGINRDSGNNGQMNVYYNHVHVNGTAISAGFTFEGNNTTDQSIVLNADGSLNSGDAAVDGGNPAEPFYDLDLTAGDAGAYGGSYTLTNFHPLHTGAARTYMTGHPFNVRQGTTLRVKAVAFDR